MTDYYLFTPPQRIAVNQLERSLCVRYPVSETVWKDANGVWQHVECPNETDLAGALELLAVSGRPQIIPDTTAAELIAAGIGTCDLIVFQPGEAP